MQLLVLQHAMVSFLVETTMTPLHVATLTVKREYDIILSSTLPLYQE